MLTGACMQTEKSAAKQAAASGRVKSYIDSCMETSRKSTAEYGRNMLSKASALSKRPMHELAAVAAGALGAAATAWWAHAPASTSKKKDGAAGSIGALPTACTSAASGASTSNPSAPTGTGAKQDGASWASSMSWAAQAATAAYAAASAASATVSAAGDVAKRMSPERKNSLQLSSAYVCALISCLHSCITYIFKEHIMWFCRCFGHGQAYRDMEILVSRAAPSCQRLCIGI
jgi:trimeric autotransporter adhesin